MKVFKYKTLTVITALLCLVGCNTNDATTYDSALEASTEDSSEIKVDFLNVGKADCITIQFDDKLFMIDSGTTESFETIEKYMEVKGYDTIDTLFITHFDKDHVGGAADVINTYNVGSVMTTYYEAKTSDEIDNYHEALEDNGLTPTLIEEETTLTLGDVTFVIYPPEETDYGNNTSNDSSLVIHMTYEDTSFLFTGDAEKARIKELLKIPDLQADVIKMPHHGQLEKNTDDLLEYVNPSFAVITSSDDEPEDEEVLELLEAREIITYLTREGMVSITSDGKTISVSQFVFM